MAVGHDCSMIAEAGVGGDDDDEHDVNGIDVNGSDAG